jgi:hypothetical protein
MNYSVLYMYVANTFLATNYDVIKLNALDGIILSKHLNAYCEWLIELYDFGFSNKKFSAITIIMSPWE